MNTIIKEVSYQPKERLEAKRKPMVIRWKGADMIRNQSVMAAVNEIVNKSENLDVVKVGIIGEPSTGKTTLADTVGHLIHKKSTIPFATRSFGKEEFKKMKETLAQLEPANYILKFGDLSFLKADFTTKEIDVIKQVMTTIRHLKEDVKIILIYDYHYSLGLDKYLRQTDFKFYTSVGSEEFNNIINQVGNKYIPLVQRFKGYYHQMTGEKKQVTINLGNPRKPIPFTYKYKNPFVMCLFWNENTLRPVVFPKRHWVDKLCPTCSIQENLPPDLSLDQYIRESYEKWGIQTFETAVKLIARDNGINVFSHSVKQCTKYNLEAMKKRQIPLAALISYMDLDPSDSPMRQKLDGILLEPPKIDTSVK